MSTISLEIGFVLIAFRFPKNTQKDGHRLKLGCKKGTTMSKKGTTMSSGLGIPQVSASPGEKKISLEKDLLVLGQAGQETPGILRS